MFGKLIKQSATIRAIAALSCGVGVIGEVGEVRFEKFPIAAIPMLFALWSPA